MKNFAKYSLAMLAMFVVLMAVGVMSFTTGLSCIALTQLAAFAVAVPCGAVFNTVLTPEQIKEFGDIVGELKGYKELFPQIKDLGTTEGGFAAIKALPALLKLVQAEQQKSEATLKDVQKILLKRGSSNAVARHGAVSEDCARHLGAVVLLAGIRGGQINGGTEKANAEALFKEITGIEAKAAITSGDMPLPVGYSGEVVELVSMWGAARKFATVFPLGTGTIKLPKLTTDPTFGLIAGSATVTEKSPQYGFVTFNAEKFGGLIRLPSEIIEDSVVNIGQFVARYVARQLAYVEDYQVFRSSGAASGLNGTAEGLCKSTITDSKVTQMATTKTKFSDATLANFRAVRAVPDAAALRNGAYYLHPTFEQLLNTFNTAGDKPFNPNAQNGNVNGQPLTNGATLDGFPIRWVDSMPAYSTSANVSSVFALFGDLSFQYLGIRGGVRFDTSLDAGFATDEILVRGIERMTTGKMAVGAIAGLQTAAS